MAEWFITAYWGQKALQSLLPEADQMLLGRANEGWCGPCAIVLAQAVVGAAATIMLLWQTKGKAASR
jgi:hypothetical protein